MAAIALQLVLLMLYFAVLGASLVAQARQRWRLSARLALVGAFAAAGIAAGDLLLHDWLAAGVWALCVLIIVVIRRRLLQEARLRGKGA